LRAKNKIERVQKTILERKLLLLKDDGKKFYFVFLKKDKEKK
jgi:hypothetical protein